MQEMVTLHIIHIKCHIKRTAALRGDQISVKAGGAQTVAYDCSSFFDVDCYKTIVIDIATFSLNNTFHVFNDISHTHSYQDAG